MYRNNKINVLQNIAYDKQQCTNALSMDRYCTMLMLLLQSYWQRMLVQCTNTINILHNIVYDKQQCRNALTSILHNVKAITANILPLNVDCNGININILHIYL